MEVDRWINVTAMFTVTFTVLLMFTCFVDGKPFLEDCIDHAAVDCAVIRGTPVCKEVWVYEYCPVSCGVCGMSVPDNSNGKCEDKDTECDTLKDNLHEYCKDVVVRENCPKSCGVCGHHNKHTHPPHLLKTTPGPLTNTSVSLPDIKPSSVTTNAPSSNSPSQSTKYSYSSNIQGTSSSRLQVSPSKSIQMSTSTVHVEPSQSISTSSNNYYETSSIQIKTTSVVSNYISKSSLYTSSPLIAPLETSSSYNHPSQPPVYATSSSVSLSVVPSSPVRQSSSIHHPDLSSSKVIAQSQSPIYATTATSFSRLAYPSSSIFSPDVSTRDLTKSSIKSLTSTPSAYIAPSRSITLSNSVSSPASSTTSSMYRSVSYQFSRSVPIVESSVGSILPQSIYPSSSIKYPIESATETVFTKSSLVNEVLTSNEISRQTQSIYQTVSNQVSRSLSNTRSFVSTILSKSIYPSSSTEYPVQASAAFQMSVEGNQGLISSTSSSSSGIHGSYSVFPQDTSSQYQIESSERYSVESSLKNQITLLTNNIIPSRSISSPLSQSIYPSSSFEYPTQKHSISSPLADSQSSAGYPQESFSVYHSSEGIKASTDNQVSSHYVPGLPVSAYQSIPSTVDQHFSHSELIKPATNTAAFQPYQSSSSRLYVVPSSSEQVGPGTSYYQEVLQTSVGVMFSETENSLSSKYQAGLHSSIDRTSVNIIPSQSIHPSSSNHDEIPETRIPVNTTPLRASSTSIAKLQSTSYVNSPIELQTSSLLAASESAQSTANQILPSSSSESTPRPSEVYVTSDYTSTLSGITQIETTTKPKVGRSCRVCDDPFCDLGFESVAMCHADTPYCMNDISFDGNGERKLSKKCASVNDCQKKWLQETTTHSECMNFDNNKVYTNLQCSYCCVTDGCNSHTIPDVTTRFGDVQH